MAANEEPAPDRGSRPGALSGIRVIKLADELAEYCGLTLAGLGADVVKVEPPGGPDEVDMSKVIGALDFHTERVSEPAEVIPALRRALDVNTSGRPAYIEFICCQYPVYGQWVGRGEG